MRVEEAAAIGTYLSFSLFGFNREEQVSVPGTGFRIAPRLALTAKHVTDEIFRRLALREGMRIPRRQSRYSGVEVRAAQQEIGTLNTELTPWWYIDGAFDSKLTDISLLKLSPGNDAARRADEEHRYLRWSLSPPAVDQRLWAFGYEMLTLHRERADAVTFINVEYTASTQPVKVTSIYSKGRREEPLDVPEILVSDRPLSMFDYPSFEVVGELSQSMSGGPVFNGDVLYGVVSTGWPRTENEIDGVREAGGTVALLQPLLEMGQVRLDEADTPLKIAELIDTGRIRSV